MLKKMDPAKTTHWQRLKDHFQEVKPLRMKDLFAADPERFEKFSLRFRDILVDYSKNRVTDETLQLLFGLAEEVALKDAVEQMFSGGRINETEDRPVLHTALRNRENKPVYVDGRDVMPDVNAVLGKDESLFRPRNLRHMEGIHRQKDHRYRQYRGSADRTWGRSW